MPVMFAKRTIASATSNDKQETQQKNSVRKELSSAFIGNNPKDYKNKKRKNDEFSSIMRNFFD